MGSIEENQDVVLNNQESKTVILKRKPDEEGNIFKQQEGSRGLIYRTSDGGTSTLTLQKDSNLADMSYYIESVIQVYSGSHLIMNLDSIGGQGLFGVYGGSILADGSTIEINNVNTFVVDAMLGNGIQVENGGTLNINNVDVLINKDNTFSATIKNLDSTLYIDADVYNYDKENSRGGGRLEHNGENAQTTIDGSFYNTGL